MMTINIATDNEPSVTIRPITPLARQRHEYSYTYAHVEFLVFIKHNKRKIYLVQFFA